MIINEQNDDKQKDKRCAISCEILLDDTEIQNKSQKSKLLNAYDSNRRPSCLVRPKTSLGRNHSLYSNNKKYNFSCIQTKVPIEQYNTNRSISEQGNGEWIVNTTLADSSIMNVNEISKDTNGQPQGQPKLTK